MKKIVAMTVMMGLGFGVVLGVSVPVVAITAEQEDTIASNCDAIKTSLVNVQHEDSRTRVYLGRYYETILSKFITPLNVRLVENNLSNNNLINNQNSFAKTRTNFVIDYIEYQKALESLVSMDCRAEPGKFYEKLTEVRSKRAIVAEDATRLKILATEQMTLVSKLKGSL